MIEATDDKTTAVPMSVDSADCFEACNLEVRRQKCVLIKIAGSFQTKQCNDETFKANKKRKQQSIHSLKRGLATGGLTQSTTVVKAAMSWPDS